jgi:hypothetical protein
VYAADVDRDGDTDVLSASNSDNKIAWYENNGSQSFTAHTITTAANSAASVYATDVDGDGDTDVLSASSGDDKIAWYENNGSQNFTAHILTTAVDAALSVYAADVDGDGDTDILSASYSDKKIAWYENNGSENFTQHIITTTAPGGPRSVYASDVDGDGDLDVLAAGSHPITWYDNRHVSGDLDKEPRDPTILPWNPPIPAPPAPGPKSTLDRVIKKHIDSHYSSQPETETLTKPVRRIARLSSPALTNAQRDAFFVESDLRMSFAGF